MENNTRQPFKKYKELRVYFNIRKYGVIQYNCEGMEFDLPFDWFKFSSRGVTFKDKNSGMEIHFKYSSVNGTCSSALIIEDVELYTPFIKENDKVKFITWEEWNEKYNTEAICKRITTVTDEHLKEHGTEMMYILDKLCSCAGHPNFDHPHRFIKVEPRYQDNEYSIHRVAADFKWHYGTKKYDYIRYLFEYTPKNHTIHIDISKHATYDIPTIFSSPFLANTVPDDFKADTYSIDVEFNKDYSISKVTVKNKNKENLLKFMEMGNPVIKNTIRQIRDYINAKLTEKQLTSRINVTNMINMYTQTWNISSRCDIISKKRKNPTYADIRNAMEHAKAYDIEHTYFTTVVKYLFDEFGLTTDPSDINGIYQGDASNKNENIFVSVNKDANIVKLSVYDKQDDDKYIVVKMEFDNEDGFMHNVNVESSSFKDCYDLLNSISINTRKTLYGLRTLVKSATSVNDFSFGILDEHPFRLNMRGDIYRQISKECKRIIRSIRNSSFHYTPTDDDNWEAEIVYRTNTTVTGGILRIQFIQLYKDRTHEKVQFVKVYVDNMYKHNICHVDIEFTKNLEVHSMSINPIHDKFMSSVNTINEPQIQNLLVELFRLFNGPFS